MKRSSYLRYTKAFLVLLNLTLMLLSLSALGQQPHAQIKGRVMDEETLEPISFGTVVLLKNGEVITGAYSDYDGYYNLKVGSDDFNGPFTLKASFVGYEDEVVEIQIQANKVMRKDFVLRYFDVGCFPPMPPLPQIQLEENPSQKTYTQEEIKRQPR